MKGSGEGFGFGLRVRVRERVGLLHVLDADGKVDALHLLQHAQPHQPAHCPVVLREGRVGSDRGEHGGCLGLGLG